MNQRDITAFNNISNIVDNMRDDERVLIFYGSAHGVTNPIKQAYTDSTALFGRRSFMWKSFSAMLKEKYEDDFESFAHVSFNDYMNNHILDNNVINEYSEYHKIIFMEDAKNFDLPHDLKTSLNLYDGFIMDQESTYGIYHQYVPNYENLQFIFSSLKEMEKNTDMFKLEDNYFHWQDQGQYLMYIYYLKLYFGDAFDYQFWNPAKPLAEVLSDLEQNVFVNKETLNENLCFSKDIETLREYHKLMIVSNVLGFVERLPSMDNAWLARDMEKAVELFPEDLWAWYWLAYAKTEDGQYEEAAQLWKYIISQPLAYCMETLPKCYEQLAYCYEQLGDIEKSTKSMTLASGLTNEHGLNVSEYVDMR
jgi:hypothetical protein